MIHAMSMTRINSSTSTSLPLPSRLQQQIWAQLPVRARLQSIRSFRQRLAKESERICQAVREDIGKPEAETLGGELLPLADACRFLERQAPRILRPRHPSWWDRPLWLFGQRDVVHRRPRGIVGVIGTWNYPLFLNGTQIAQALVAGNAVVWKPSEVSPRSAEVLADLWRQSGVPEGLFECWPATREAGRELAEADVDHVVFTGHADTGRQLAAALGRRLVSSTLELSGCDAMLVLQDADVELAARAAWFAATVNAGQTCLAVRRAFVDRTIHDRFVQHLQSLATAAQPVRLALHAQARQAEQLVHDAVADGARQPIKSDFDPDRFLPIILTDVRPEMAVCREASFAPLLAVLPFDRLEEAVAAQDQCPYALGASIFTRDVARGNLLASRLRAGMVSINDVIAPTAHPATPFGGHRASGWGVTQGAEGLLEMTVPQVVSVRRGSWRPHYDPAGSTKMTSQALLAALLQWGHAASWRDRLAGAWKVVRESLRGG
jgi:acyl-CoA reductase-like NAD-dependent aldehyde dehydrogenase